MATYLPPITIGDPTPNAGQSGQFKKPNNGNSPWDQLVKAIQQGVQNAGNGVIKGANAAGKAVGNTSVSPLLPNIKINDVLKKVLKDNPSALTDITSGQVQNIPTDLAKSTQESIHTLAHPTTMGDIGMVAGTLSGGEMPEIPNELQTGDRFVAEGELPQGRKPAEIRATAGQNPPRLNYVPTAASEGIPSDLPPSQMNPSAESFTSNPSAQIKPSVGQIEPQPALSLRQKAIQKLNGLDNYQLSKNYGGNRTPFETQDKSVMQNIVGGNTANDVLKNIPQAKESVWKNVENSVSKVPNIEINTQIVPHLQSNLKDLVDQGLISQPQADEVLLKQKAKLLGSDINATTVAGKDFLDTRTGANTLARKGLGPDGQLKDNATIEQIINKAVADGYKDALINVSPEAKYFSNQYSSLKRIEDMSNEFRNQKLNVGKIPGTQIGVPFTGALRRVTSEGLNGNPKVLLPAAGIAGASATLIGKNVYDTANGATNGSQNNPQNEQINNGPNHAQTISQPITDVNQLPENKADIKPINGTWIVADPTQIKGADGSTLAINPTQYQSQLGDFNKQITDLNNEISANPFNPKIEKANNAKITGIKQQIDTLNTKNNQSSGLLNGQEVAKNATSKLADINQLVGSVGKGVLQFNPFFDQFNSQLNQAHNQFQADLDALKGMGYGDLADTIRKTKDPKAAYGAIYSANQNILDQWHKSLKEYGGTSGPTSTRATEQVPTAIKATLPAINKGGFSVPPANTDFQVGGSLPPIQ